MLLTLDILCEDVLLTLDILSEDVLLTLDILCEDVLLTLDILSEDVLLTLDILCEDVLLTLDILCEDVLLTLDILSEDVLLTLDILCEDVLLTLDILSEDVLLTLDILSEDNVDVGQRLGGRSLDRLVDLVLQPQLPVGAVRERAFAEVRLVLPFDHERSRILPGTNTVSITYLILTITWCLIYSQMVAEKGSYMILISGGVDFFLKSTGVAKVHRITARYAL